MNTLMPCGLEDDRIRFEPDAEEDEDILTPMENRLKWICEMWSVALEADTSEEWQEVLTAIYGAKQTLIYGGWDRVGDKNAMDDLRRIAFENQIDCIQRGKYEGATA